MTSFRKKFILCVFILSLIFGMVSCKSSADHSVDFTQVQKTSETIGIEEAKESGKILVSSQKAAKTESKESKESESESEVLLEEKQTTVKSDVSSQTEKQVISTTTTSARVTNTTGQTTQKGPSQTIQKVTSSTTQATAAQTTQPTSPPTSTTPTSTAPVTQRVSLSVNCTTAVNAGNETAKLISSNGVILATTVYEVKPGTTALDLIVNSGLTVGVNGGYVYSIQSLGEFDVNGKGGWHYYVNGVRPGYGAGSYVLNAGDQVAFEYTLDY